MVPAYRTHSTVRRSITAILAPASPTPRMSVPEHNRHTVVSAIAATVVAHRPEADTTATITTNTSTEARQVISTDTKANTAAATIKVVHPIAANKEDQSASQGSIFAMFLCMLQINTRAFIASR